MGGYRDYLPTLRFAPTLALSPDGRMVAYVDDRLGQFNVVVQPLSGERARALTSFEKDAVRRVVWHPDGRSVLFEADSGGDEFTRLCLINVEGGEQEVLVADPKVRYTLAQVDPFSPDGRLLAFTGNDREPADEDVLVRDMVTGQVRRVFTGTGQSVIGSWSPDGTRLSVAQCPEALRHVVHVVPVDGPPPIRLTSAQMAAPFWLGPWTADGSAIVVRTNAGGREFTALARLDATTGELTWLDTPGWDVEGAAGSPDGRWLVWVVNVDGASRLRGRDLVAARELAMPSVPDGMIADLKVSPDGQTLVMRHYTATEPMAITAVDQSTGRRRTLTDARASSADPATFVEAAPVHIPAGGGRHVPAYLYRPQQEGRVGVLLSIHGGPAYQERPLYSMYDGLYQYLLHHGLAVLAPNVRGSTGYGLTYRQALYRDWGGVDLDDLATVAQYLQEQDWADPQRIGLLGASYGGFAVLSCVSRLPEVGWAAAVDMFGPSNLVTFARSQPPAWRQMVRTVVGDHDTDAEFLMSRSPVTYADRIRTPLLVIQGANDPRVPQAESDQIVQRLRARGVQVRYDVYPDTGHGFTRREDQIRAYSDIAEFLVTHLGS
jgi:dipeptidyl aminopeptidase/acylaminoacyl peptidase